MPNFWDNYVPRERPEGRYVSMTDMSRLGEPYEIVEVIDDDENIFKGNKMPRFLLKGKIQGGSEETLVSVPKGYSRDELVMAIAEYLEAEGDGAAVLVRFQKATGSAYIDILKA
jgi:hypothetical protein